VTGAPSRPPALREAARQRGHVAERVLELVTGDLDDEGYLREFRYFGHQRRLVERLLHMDRFGEAVREMEAGSGVASVPAAWRALADDLVRLG